MYQLEDGGRSFIIGDALSPANFLFGHGVHKAMLDGHWVAREIALSNPNIPLFKHLSNVCGENYASIAESPHELSDAILKEHGVRDRSLLDVASSNIKEYHKYNVKTEAMRYACTIAANEAKLSAILSTIEAAQRAYKEQVKDFTIASAEITDYQGQENDTTVTLLATDSQLVMEGEY